MTELRQSAEVLLASMMTHPSPGGYCQTITPPSIVGQGFTSLGCQLWFPRRVSDREWLAPQHGYLRWRLARCGSGCFREGRLALQCATVRVILAMSALEANHPKEAFYLPQEFSPDWQGSGAWYGAVGTGA
jgi:hypothetical protein